MLRGLAVSLPAIALVAGCAPPQLEEPVPSPAAAPVTCDAALYTYLVGEPIESVYGLNTGRVVRILGPDEFVTRDFDPNRLTFTTTPSDTIGRVFCG